MKIIVIVGPTGVGKTKMSIELAKKYNAEIINADSVQIYKGLNIGSAKVTKDEMDNITHHLLDIKNVDEDYSAYDYQIDARKKIEEIKSKGKNIIIVGGTGLYIKALLFDYKFDIEDKSNFNNYERFSNDELYVLLKNKYSNIDVHKNNRKRIIRLLNKNSNEENNNGNKLLYDTIFIGLTTDRDNLYNIINNRVDKMINDGLIDEVDNLYKKYKTSRILNSAIGYKELIKYFNNEISLEEAINLIKQNSRKYAKRQYTWFNNQMNINWFNVDYNNFDNTINEVIKFINKN